MLSFAGSEVGTPDLGLGAKLRLFGQGPIGVSAITDIRLSFDSDDPNKLLHRTLLLTSARLGRLFLHMNFGMALNNLRGGGGTNIGFAYGGEMSARLPISRLRLYAGANGVTGDSSIARLEQGLSLYLSRDKQVGITTQVGLTSSAPNFLGGLFLRLSL